MIVGGELEYVSKQAEPDLFSKSTTFRQSENGLQAE
jgi:hypothetical protein